jgi:signal transduction histidine kinase
VSRLFREAVGDTQEQYDVLLTHLSLIRDLVDLGQNAESLAELYSDTAKVVVSELGYEQVAVVLGAAGNALEVVGSYGQSERFGGVAGPVPTILLTLARDVITERTLLRWGGEGIGVRRPLPPTLEGSVIGFPLIIGDERVGAMMCVQVLPVVWDLVSQRALELAGEVIGQVLTLGQMRLSLDEIRRSLECELGSTRNQISQHEHTLRAQSDRIAGLATSLIASNNAKRTFLALMSHELRTPLSVILGYGSILREGVVGTLNTDQEVYLDRIQTNGRHLHQLVEDMLFFVDAETTRIIPTWSEVDLAELVHDVVATIPRTAGPEAPTLVVAVAPEARVMRTDPGLLRRILFHLIGNAFKFTEEGEVRVDATRTQAGGVDLRIIDSGVGIAPDQSRRIFELFRQGDDRHARKHEGVGLGLNLARACLGLLQGRCHIESPPQGGTRVEIHLPPVAQMKASVDQSRSPAAPVDAGSAAVGRSN